MLSGSVAGGMTNNQHDTKKPKLTTLIRKRGWTFQELIAPYILRFYFQDWTLMGDKIEFEGEISTVTGIPTFVLQNGDLDEISIANRMSWCSNRKTTRVEDLAYCLLGIFDIQMPLLYGEGVKAFIRLQEEILKTSDDYSLFAWFRNGQDRTPSKFGYGFCLRGLLARSPEEFWSYSENKVEPEDTSSVFPIALTPIGLRLQLELQPSPKYTNASYFVAFIRCTNDENQRLAVSLRRLGGENQCARINPGTVICRNDWPTGELTTIYVRQKMIIPQDYFTPYFPAFCIQRRRSDSTVPSVRLLKVYPPGNWSSENRQLLPPEPDRNYQTFLDVLFLQGPISAESPCTDFQIILCLDKKTKTYRCKSVEHSWPRLDISPERFRAVIKKSTTSRVPIITFEGGVKARHLHWWGRQ